MVHLPGFLPIFLWGCMVRRAAPSPFSFMLVKHLEESSQQCNCLRECWLSTLISPPASSPLWLQLLCPEATDASFPLPSLDSGPEDLMSRHRIPPRVVFKSLHPLHFQTHKFTQLRNNGIQILRGQASVGAYCIDLHHFLRAEGNMVKTPIGFLHFAAMDQWL